MKILFYLGHPAHFHLFRNVKELLRKNNHEVIIVIKRKDVLENLVRDAGWDYFNVYPKERKDTKLSVAISLIKRDMELFKIVRETRPDLMIGTSAEISHAGKIFGIPSVVVNEDDASEVPLFAKLSYPFASVVLSPESCKNGKWEYKSIKYSGYHELCYLNPDYFSPRTSVHAKLLNEESNYFIIRFAKLTAHHDDGKKGLTRSITATIIKKLEQYGKVYISSERLIEDEFRDYVININPSEMIDALSGASLYVGDSQTMAAEAAVLGVPSIRFNDFVCKLGYLEELEHKYGLTYGIKTSEPEKLLAKIDELLAIPNLKQEWEKRRQKMLADKIDVTAFMVWFIENYPMSVDVMKKNPDYQYRFR